MLLIVRGSLKHFNCLFVTPSNLVNYPDNLIFICPCFVI